MKRIIAVLSVIAVVISFSACGQKASGNEEVAAAANDITTEDVSFSEEAAGVLFRGIIKELEDGAMLVIPDGEAYDQETALFRIPTEFISPDSPAPAAGDRVEVIYGGVIEELYPSDFKDISSVTVIKAEPRTAPEKPADAVTAAAPATTKAPAVKPTETASPVTAAEKTTAPAGTINDDVYKRTAPYPGDSPEFTTAIEEHPPERVAERVLVEHNGKKIWLNSADSAYIKTVIFKFETTSPALFYGNREYVFHMSGNPFGGDVVYYDSSAGVLGNSSIGSLSEADKAKFNSILSGYFPE